ncbi:MAG: L-lactate dehydrogenase [Solobacterium sp.]|nr:L-lactate dehydrogenase [Solobacterium sp.]
MSVNHRKVAVIGCGFVGATSAFAIMQSGLFSEMVLLDVNHDKAEGEAMDISHGTALVSPMRVYAGDYDDIADAAIIVVTAGAAQKPGETRLDLIHKNVSIFSGIMKEIRARKPEGIMLVVANPVDILTYYAAKTSGMGESRVFGSGTVLDTSRLRTLLSTKLDVDSRNIHAYIVGEHGDSEIVCWSNADVSGVPLADFFALRGMGDIDFEETQKEISDDVKNSAYEIIAKKHATYYGIGMSVARICKAIAKDEKSVLPVSVVLNGEYGISNCALSVPAIVCRNGVESLVPISMSEAEREALNASAEVLKQNMSDIDFSVND